MTAVDFANELGADVRRCGAGGVAVFRSVFAPNMFRSILDAVGLAHSAEVLSDGRIQIIFTDGDIPIQ